MPDWLKISASVVLAMVCLAAADQTVDLIVAHKRQDIIYWKDLLESMAFIATIIAMPGVFVSALLVYQQLAHQRKIDASEKIAEVRKEWSDLMDKLDNDEDLREYFMKYDRNKQYDEKIMDNASEWRRDAVRFYIHAFRLYKLDVYPKAEWRLVRNGISNMMRSIPFLAYWNDVKMKLDATLVKEIEG
jgi:hypothetical protein